MSPNELANAFDRLKQLWSQVDNSILSKEERASLVGKAASILDGIRYEFNLRLGPPTGLDNEKS